VQWELFQVATTRSMLLQLIILEALTQVLYYKMLLLRHYQVHQSTSNEQQPLHLMRPRFLCNGMLQSLMEDRQFKAIQSIGMAE